jgi:dynein heavy chain, axonemal
MKKLVEASEQLAVLNDKLAVQRIAVVEKTAACEALLSEISAGTQRAEEKKNMALEKGKEIAEQSKDIETEKVKFV